MTPYSLSLKLKGKFLPDPYRVPRCPGQDGHSSLHRHPPTRSAFRSESSFRGPFCESHLMTGSLVSTVLHGSSGPLLSQSSSKSILRRTIRYFHY